MLNFDLNDKRNLRVLEECRETALRQIAELQPQNVAGFYDFARRIPRWFLFNGLGAIGAAQRHMEQSKSNYKRMKFAIEHCGCVAPFCNQDQLRAYMDFVGKARTAQECNYIFCMGLPYSEAAGKLINQWRNLRPNDWVFGAERTLYRLDMPLMLPVAPVAEETPVDRHSAVGTNTRLGAIAVPVVSAGSAAPLDDPVRLVSPVAVGAPEETSPPVLLSLGVSKTQPAEKESPDLVDVPLGIANYEYLLSRIFLGGTRSGKSLLVALAIRHLRKRYGSKLQVWVMSAVYRPAEAWYWDVADKAICVDFLRASPFEIEKAYESWAKMLEEFNAIPASEDNPKLLIVDEASMIGYSADAVGTEEAKAVWHHIRMKATLLSSGGAASGMGMYLTAPVGSVGALNLTRAELGAFFPIFVSGLDEWNEAVYIAAKNNGLAPMTPPTPHVFSAARSVKAKSIIGISGKWIPYQRYDLSKYKTTAEVPKVAVASVSAIEPSIESETIAPVDVGYEAEDPALDLISEVSDRDKREALMIAYQWASKRQSEGKEVSKEAFLERARKDRNCTYLKDNRDVIWDELTGLIS
jgi:hypothetical protein